MRLIRSTKEKTSLGKNIAGPIAMSNANDKVSLMIKQLMYWTERQPTDGRCTKKKHALWKMIQRRFVSVVSADEFIWEQEKKNRITFKWKFQTNLRLMLLYSSEINLCTKYYKKESQYLRYIAAWKILYIIFESKIRRRKLVLLNSYVCNSPSRNLISVCHCCGLSFISERFKE